MARKSRVNPTESYAARTGICRAGLYRRLSEEDGEDAEQNSLGNQKKIALFYLSSHTDIRLIETYTDNGFSGMSFNRPDFKRMFDDLKSGYINCVIVKDISRLGRNFVQTSELAERLFPELGIRLICINDGYDSFDDNSDSASLTMPLKMVMNDYYAKDISNKIRSSISNMMESGEYLPSSGSVPYGYRRDAERLTYKVDAETAPVVARIYEMRASGMKFNAIAKQLNDEGVICPGRLRFIRGLTEAEKYANAVWVRGTVRKLVNDRVYIGDRIHGRCKRDRIGADKTRRDPSQWLVIENAHPSIVTRELFDAVQKVNRDELAARETFKKRPDVKDDFRDLLRGRIFCYDCGNAMFASKGCARLNAKAPSRIFYECRGYSRSNHRQCSSHYVRQETVMKAVTDLMDKQLAACVDAERLIEEVKLLPDVITYQKQAKDRYTGISAKRRNAEAKIGRLLEDLAQGLLNREEYLYTKEKYTEEYESLLEAEVSALADLQKLENAVSETRVWVDNIRQYKKLMTVTKAIMDAVINRIWIYKDKSIKIELNYEDPFLPIRRYLTEIGAAEYAV